MPYQRKKCITAILKTIIMLIFSHYAKLYFTLMVAALSIARNKL